MDIARQDMQGNIKLILITANHVSHTNTEPVRFYFYFLKKARKYALHPYRIIVVVKALNLDSLNITR